MMPIRYLILLPVLLAAIGSSFPGCTKGETDAAPAPSEPTVLSGPASYAKNCQLCHGAKGEGVKDMGTAIQRLDIRIPHDDQITHIIRNGRGKMPGYKQMSETELKALIQYIRMF
jgi:mono/diheme cytochrome c family protein